MRPFNVFILAGVAAFVLAGCEKPAPKTTRTAASNTTTRVVSGWIPDTASREAVAEAFSQPIAAPVESLVLNDDSTSNALDLITAKIDTTVILGAWLKSHPADRISEVPPLSGIDDPFCRAAVVRTRLMGRTLTRYAMFYIPELSKPDKLPTDTAGAPGDYCELRTIVLASEEMDVARGHALRDSLAQLIQARLGSPHEGLPLGAGGVRGTQGGKVWNGPGTKVIVATAPVDRPRSSFDPNRSEEEGTP
ncbi:MAG TPA: hypothetical protein VF105_11490, partial [Gemmatimonadaceae bacterium]